MKTIFLSKNNKREVTNKIIDILRNNGLVVAPSDTVYALIVNAASDKAVRKLIAFKNRPLGKPTSIFVSDFKMLEKNVEVDEKQFKILHELLPGPFTVVLNSKHKVSLFLESESKTLGIRIPNDSFINELVKKFDGPLTATSANISGQSPHYQISSLVNSLPKVKRKLIDLIVDAGKLPHNKPSTVVDLTTSDIKIIRQGEIVFKNEKNYISHSPVQTQKIGQYLLDKYLPLSKKKPLVFIIEGELGVGKTMLIKGMGKAINIDNIISPSYVIYYEYGNFYHFDLYNIQENEEFKYLGIDKLLRAKNILVFEWGEKSGDIIDLLRKKGELIYIQMKYIDEKEREIKVKS